MTKFNKYAKPVKPVSEFQKEWDALKAQCERIMNAGKETFTTDGEEEWELERLASKSGYNQYNKQGRTQHFPKRNQTEITVSAEVSIRTKVSFLQSELNKIMAKLQKNKQPRDVWGAYFELYKVIGAQFDAWYPEVEEVEA